MCETLGMTVDELLKNKQLAICEMPKDGLCLVRAYAKVMDVSKEHLVNVSP